MFSYILDFVASIHTVILCRLHRIFCGLVDAETWISLLRQYSYPTELTAELLNGLIEKIVIHEATTEDGVREQNIDIYYRLIGKIE